MRATASQSVNHWPDSKCARAFWGQHEVPAYRRLLADTVAWLEPSAGEHWLDLGCGSGQLTAALWRISQGRIAETIGLDCASVNEEAFHKLRATLEPTPVKGQIRFQPLDFSAGLPICADEYFHGVVSGLAIQYAECYSEERACWTTEAYDHLLMEIYRVLRPEGRLVYSVNVPEPSWGRVALHSLSGILRARRPARYLKNSFRMLHYGAWLSREARRGRFHFLPISVIVNKLQRTGFTAIEHRLTYARQAYLIRCRKPA